MTDIDASRIDGRSARSERTRRAIVAAHLGLIDEGDLKPTGERIAEAAGVSLRTLWTNFKDLETLFAAVGERLIELQLAVYRPIPTDRPLAERVRAFCEQRARMLEILAPAARAAVIREPFSAQLRRNRTIELDRVRAEIAALFAAEFAAAGPGRAELEAALLTAATYRVWSTLRDQLELDVATSCRVMIRMVGSLLGA
jgi:TetR/AcrR family transcriptional regulator of autoinduction and epiphytic fitness